MTVSLEDLRPDIFCHESETVLSEIGIKRKVTTTSEESSAHPRYGFYAVGQEADMVSHFRYCLHASHFSKGGVFPPYSSACSVEFASCYSSCPPKREGFAPIARTDREIWRRDEVKIFNHHDEQPDHVHFGPSSFFYDENGVLAGVLFPSSTRSGNWLVQAGKNYLAIRPGPDDRYNLVGRAIFLKRSFDADSLVSDKTSSNTDSDTPEDILALAQADSAVDEIDQSKASELLRFTPGLSYAEESHKEGKRTYSGVFIPGPTDSKLNGAYEEGRWLVRRRITDPETNSRPRRI
ncbi:uncharacterized protein GGS25DRAFT_525780 [Hypoxylon fragiforme]|uniref:uncharacterized protein n=1 Tax=Hypoxylon fragiforme TaxID=63214 RepID=UPI0020C6F797|nr:uncharacterized protein GGS25DRAFT_525780 [Hypoxylon fragiforme]KAI2604491.1 hypothetical protein GGS25DRAFT_525780 [Hypoxylon fragiforme]